jgi:hypothetical protein
MVAGCSRQPSVVTQLEAISLLPGYTLSHRQGDDTYTGRIQKDNGLSIGIDIGGLSGLWANPAEPQKHIWVYSISRSDGDVFVGLRSMNEGDKRMICTTFPKGVVNFFAEVDSESDIAEFLLMTLSFKQK